VVSFEPPDLVVLRFRGLLRSSEVAEYATLRNELIAGQRYILTLGDLQLLGGFDPECRRSIALMRDERPQMVAVVGGSFRFRVVAEMITTAARVFGKRKLTVRFFEDEDPARAWLEEMRRALVEG